MAPVYAEPADDGWTGRFTWRRRRSLKRSGIGHAATEQRPRRPDLPISLRSAALRDVSNSTYRDLFGREKAFALQIWPT